MDSQIQRKRACRHQMTIPMVQISLTSRGNLRELATASRFLLVLEPVAAFLALGCETMPQQVPIPMVVLQTNSGFFQFDG